MAKTETDAAGLVAYRLMVKGLLNTVGTMLLDSVVEAKPREPKPEVEWAIGVVANTPPTKGLGRAAHVLRTEVLALRKELEDALAWKEIYSDRLAQAELGDDGED